MKQIKTYALFVPEIKQLIEKDISALRNYLKQISIIDLAEGWNEFKPNEQIIIFKSLDIRRAVILFEELDVESQKFLLSSIGNETTEQIIQELAPGKAAHLFRKLPERVLRKMMNIVKKEETYKRINQLLSYPKNTAGSIMHTDFVALPPDMTASSAIERIRTLTKITLHEEGLLTNLYVTNKNNELEGVVSLQSLVSAPREIKIKEIMSPVQFIKINANTDQEEVAKIFTKYNLVSAPVVDEANRLIGVILIDDIIDVIHKEATEDIVKMAGTTPKELTKLSAFEIAKLRLPWLITTYFGEVIVSNVIKHFNPTLQSIIALASFSPLIAAMGNNVGTQSSTISVRALATGEVKENEFFRIGFLELKVGFIMGIIYGIFAGLVSVIMYPNLGIKFPLVIFLAMTVALTVASTAGGLEPFLFKAIGVDPATATGPIIATFTDLVGVTTYLGLATLLLM
jgi:magnesium transporter